LTTVSSWPWWNWESAGVISRNAFTPRPAVDAAILRLTNREVPLLPRKKESAWRQMVAAGFNGKGGSLFNSLAFLYSKETLNTAFRHADVPKNTIVAFVTPDQWVKIFTTVSTATPERR
ncbi:MAG: rRNA adenine N-6-methyltransferase family protein, partial [Rhodoglobus sp.]